MQYNVFCPTTAKVIFAAIGQTFVAIGQGLFAIKLCPIERKLKNISIGQGLFAIVQAIVATVFIFVSTKRRLSPAFITKFLVFS